MRIEVIMAAYNNVSAMRLVFEGYLRQQDSDFSLCVADDGSGPSVAELVLEYQHKGLRMRHLWQEDRGFRKALIVNQAIASSDADYLILTDNDCIPSPHFIADHRAWARPGSYVAGRRVDMKAPLTKQLLAGEVSGERLDSFFFLLRESLRDGLKRAENAIHPPAWLAELWSRKPWGLLGANIGIWRSDILAVNGFDRDFEGYGCEESDLEWRLQAYGLRSRAARGRACLFHLYHPERQVDSATGEMLQRKKLAGRIVAERGIFDHENV